jgi:hypothetical protein
VTATDGNGVTHSASTFVTACGQEFRLLGRLAELLRLVM